MPAPTNPPAPATLAGLLAQAAIIANKMGAGPNGARVVSIETQDLDGFHLGLWDPPAADHPLDPLIGVRSPESWIGVGITASGRCWSLDGEPTPMPVTSTVLLGRTGEAASVLDTGSGSPLALDQPPEGLAADLLARVLGLPTPPPEHTTALLAELTWLDRIASGLAHHPTRGRSWRWLADRHPLRGSGEIPSPSQLANRCTRHAACHPWSALRARADEVFGLPDPDVVAPATTVDPSRWFDDGTLARWALRRLPDPHRLVAAIAGRLPDHAIGDLRSALTEIPLDPT